MNNQPTIFPSVFAKLMEDLHSGYVERYQSAIRSLKGLDWDTIETDIQKLKALLSNSDPIIKCQAIELLLTIDIDKTLDWVLPLLEDKNPKVRKRVLIDLIDNECRNTKVVAPLIKILQYDDNPNARGNAAFLLGRMGDERAVPVLKEVQANDTETDYEGVPIGVRASQALVYMGYE